MSGNLVSTASRRLMPRWLRLALLSIGEVAIAVWIAALLHPNHQFLRPRDHEVTIDWTAIATYIGILTLLVILEHSAAHLVREIISGNWKAIQELMESKQSLPAGMIPAFAELLARPDSVHTRQLLQAIEKSLKLPQKVKDAIHSFLINLEVHEYAEDVFARRIRKTLTEMGSLRREESFEADLATQYELAAGLADRFNTPELETVYATALDPPGKFINDFGFAYFRTQTLLPAIDPIGFGRLVQPEVRLLSELSALTRKEIEEKQRTARSPRCPGKARIVVTSINDMVRELESEGEGFLRFNKWHLNWGFGLRYYVLDEAFFNIRGDDKLYEEYSKNMVRLTNADNFSEVIGDFVVYNGSVVFGRTNLKYEHDRQIYIRMIHTPQKVNAYRNLFIGLWEEAMPLWELWVYLEKQHRMSGIVDQTLRRVAQDMLVLFGERYPTIA